jgi:DNA-binding response OmpR family regulator
MVGILRKVMIKKSKILIIDDERAILNALQIFLEQQGYSVEATDKYAGYLDKAKFNKLPDSH